MSYLTPFRFRASSTHGYAPQTSPNMNVDFPDTSSPSTKSASWDDFAVSGLLIFSCSVASMTFLFVASSVRRECGQRGHSGWHLPSHSQASSPRSVTLPQLPSPRIIPQSNKWRIVILKTPITMQGTFTPKSTPQVGRTGLRSAQSPTADQPRHPGDRSVLRMMLTVDLIECREARSTFFVVSRSPDSVESSRQ